MSYNRVIIRVIQLSRRCVLQPSYHSSYTTKFSFELYNQVLIRVNKQVNDMSYNQVLIRVNNQVHIRDIDHVIIRVIQLSRRCVLQLSYHSS